MQKVFHQVNIEDDDILEYLNVEKEQEAEEFRINGEIQDLDIDNHHI